MSARLAAAWHQETLIPKGRAGFRMWRSGKVGEARVAATSRSHSQDAQNAASRILGGLAFPSYTSGSGTVYGRVDTLQEDTGGWVVLETAHPNCPACVSSIVEAISLAAVRGSVEATYGTSRFDHWADDERLVPVYAEHHVKIGRAS